MEVAVLLELTNIELVLVLDGIQTVPEAIRNVLILLLVGSPHDLEAWEDKVVMRIIVDQITLVDLVVVVVEQVPVILQEQVAAVAIPVEELELIVVLLKEEVAVASLVQQF